MFFYVSLFISSFLWVYKYLTRKEKSRIWSTIVNDIPVGPDETPVRRYYTHSEMQIGADSAPHPEFRTINDSLKKSVKVWGNNKTMGMRRLKYMVSEGTVMSAGNSGNSEQTRNRKAFPCYGEYEWITYNDMWTILGNIGAGLRKIGVNPKEVFGVWAPTSRPCTTFMFGSLRQNIPLVTIYNTLGKSGLYQALSESNACGLFLRVDQLPDLDDLPDELPNIKRIIYFGEGEWDHQCASKSQHVIEKLSKHMAVLSLSELISIGSRNPIEDSEPDPDDTVCIMYTSGTSGNPRGVIMTHKTVLSSLIAFDRVLLSYKKDDDLYLSYLPTSHVMEFSVQVTLISIGIPIGYGTPYSLTDAMVRDCKGDLTELRPTLLVGVPQVWDTIRKEIMYEVRRRGLLVEHIFNWMINLKWVLTRLYLPTQLLDMVAFRRVRNGLGGRLRYALSGGSSISLDTQKLLTATLCPILQGYGMTECSAAISLQQPNNFCLQRAGPVVPCVEMKLVSVPEAGFYAKDGTGEVFVRGTTITPGYLNPEDPSKPIPVLTPDGWFRTGDIAKWHPDGQIQIIDRIKNIQKLANGEYISIEKLEGVYKMSLYVTNVCIDVQPDQRRPLAIVEANPKTLMQLGQRLGYHKNSSMSKICKDPNIKYRILKSLLRAAKRNRFSRAETIIDCVIDPESWTSENGLLTAASKLKRHDIKRKLNSEIKYLYSIHSDF